MSDCKHDRRLPNPAGGAWFCADCGAYPLICTPGTKADLNDCAAIIQRLRKERDELRSEVRYVRTWDDHDAWDDNDAITMEDLR